MIELIGFDGDDTLWHSEGYYQAANAEFSRIVGQYVDLDDAGVRAQMLATERRNLALFGYGAKGMTLSMVETAIAATGERITAADIHRIVEMGKEVLRHPVELLPGIREAVQAVARQAQVVLITKGDLFHQEKKVEQSGLSDLFHRIEIVSEKNPASYRRVLDEFGLPPERFLMVGNSLRSDIEPVIRLGGWGVHMPYHVTWSHELDHGLGEDESHMLSVDGPDDIAAAVEQLMARAG
ncbi:HAD family hydrolase [Oleiagrimonas sp. C23AA]|uniref:HAD family hydrolase n=1 Tax=Oleiagrimonas sp. C23AA TaxID=2719047 RepID=UPI00141D8F85|nr:HAD family hydrolase [Oleiagrimonas sp. C23AA]NII09716.1 HAD family hydrolase [Oleiagrimonas sp. C23AA]